MPEIIIRDVMNERDEDKKADGNGSVSTGLQSKSSGHHAQVQPTVNL
jgi:hypothetical protein